MISTPVDVPTVAIVGGGFTGAAVAFHLASAGPRARILVFEPRPLLGAGLAYSDVDPAHRVNVPAGRMSLLPGNEAHFTRWLHRSGALESDPSAIVGDAAFPRRLEFGRYVDAMVRPLVRRGRIVHAPEAVASVRRAGGDWLLRTASGVAIRIMSQGVV